MKCIPSTCWMFRDGQSDVRTHGDCWPSHTGKRQTCFLICDVKICPHCIPSMLPCHWNCSAGLSPLPFILKPAFTSHGPLPILNGGSDSLFLPAPRGREVPCFCLPFLFSYHSPLRASPSPFLSFSLSYGVNSGGWSCLALTPG